MTCPPTSRSATRGVRRDPPQEAAGADPRCDPPPPVARVRRRRTGGRRPPRLAARVRRRGAVAVRDAPLDGRHRGVDGAPCRAGIVPPPLRHPAPGRRVADVGGRLPQGAHRRRPPPTASPACSRSTANRRRGRGALGARARARAGRRRPPVHRGLGTRATAVCASAPGSTASLIHAPWGVHPDKRGFCRGPARRPARALRGSPTFACADNARRENPVATRTPTSCPHCSMGEAATRPRGQGWSECPIRDFPTVPLSTSVATAAGSVPPDEPPH
jgi:hypothetical protein